MNNQIQIIGASNTIYYYEVFLINHNNFNQVPGNYIFAKQNGNSYLPIYFGQTHDLSNRFQNHHKIEEAKRKGATHLLARLNKGGESSRKYEEADLLRKYPTAYRPTGCNEKIGG